MGHDDAGLGQCGIGRVFGQTGDDGAVDLQIIDVELAHVERAENPVPKSSMGTSMPALRNSSRRCVMRGESLSKEPSVISTLMLLPGKPPATKRSDQLGEVGLSNCNGDLFTLTCAMRPKTP